MTDPEIRSRLKGILAKARKQMVIANAGPFEAATVDDAYAFLADQDYVVTSIRSSHDVDSSSTTVQPINSLTTVAPGSGQVIIPNAIDWGDNEDLGQSAVLNGARINRLILNGNAVGLLFAGVATSLRGAMLSILMLPLPDIFYRELENIVDADDDSMILEREEGVAAGAKLGAHYITAVIPAAHLALAAVIPIFTADRDYWIDKSSIRMAWSVVAGDATAMLQTRKATTFVDLQNAVVDLEGTANTVTSPAESSGGDAQDLADGSSLVVEIGETTTFAIGSFAELVVCVRIVPKEDVRFTYVGGA